MADTLHLEIVTAGGAAVVPAPPVGTVKALATSAMFRFMPASAASVIFCTSSAWMVALSAVPFCSSQNSTAFNSLMRLSSSSTLTVGATQLCSPGAAPPAPRALADSFCKKSNPGMNLPKSNALASLMAAPF